MGKARNVGAVPGRAEQMDRLPSEPAWMDGLVQDAEQEQLQDKDREDQPVSNEQLMSYAKELIGVEEELQQKEAEVNQLKDRRKQLRTQLIPDAMKALKMLNSKGKGSFTYQGNRFHLESKISASCNEANRPILFEFLRHQGDENLIKETVNPSTLSAYVRERREDGLNDPPGIAVFEEVTAKRTRLDKA